MRDIWGVGGGGGGWGLCGCVRVWRGEGVYGYWCGCEETRMKIVIIILCRLMYYNLNHMCVILFILQRTSIIKYILFN